MTYAPWVIRDDVARGVIGRLVVDEWRWRLQECHSRLLRDDLVREHRGMPGLERRGPLRLGLRRHVPSQRLGTCVAQAHGLGLRHEHTWDVSSFNVSGAGRETRA